MLKININEFNRYDSKTLYEFLFLQRETAFEITIPKNTVADQTDDYTVFEEYLVAAYTGQRLSEISKRFAYYVPCVLSKSHFSFEITTNEMGKLAEVLYLIIHCVNDKIPSEAFLTFHSLAADFLTNALRNRVDCNTPGLLMIANRYFQKL